MTKYKKQKQMARLNALDPDNASGKTKDLFNAIHSKFGIISNMMRTMGNTPVLLEGFMSFYGSLSTGSLDAKTNELIALTISEAHGCSYCLASHKFIGANYFKLDADTMDAARQGKAKDKKVDAILKFALALVNKRGGVNDSDVATLKSAGISDGEIGEIIGQVALNTLTNYFNIAAGTDIDAVLK
jgi:uncharacterized peroxidase-related enzyme